MTGEIQTPLATEVYQPLVDQWILYDNAGKKPVLIDWSEAMKSPHQVREQAATYDSLPADADEFLKGSFAALCRAAQRAREVAKQTGTDLILFQDGQVVRLKPE